MVNRILQVRTPPTATGGGGFPAGVTLREPDGTRTYFQTGYFNGTSQVPFDKATGWPASIPFTAGNQVYTHGWDDPKFMAIGGFLQKPDTTQGIQMYHDLNWTTLFGCFSNLVFTTWGNSTTGLSLVCQENEMFTAGGGTNNGNLYFNGVSSGNLPACIPALLHADEPEFQNVIKDPIGGTTTYQDGTNGLTATGSTGTINNLIQDGRPWIEGLAGSTFCISQTYNTSPSNSTPFFFPPFTNTYPTPNATVRPGGGVDMLDWDIYMIPTGRYADYWGSTPANAVAGTFGATPMTMLQMCRGTHQGTWVDYMRNFCTNRLTGGYTRPTAPALGVANGKVNVPYFWSPQEFNWEVWGCLIHGARYLPIFDHSDECGYYNHITNPGGFTGGSNDPSEGTLLNTDFALNQTVTFTGAINSSTNTLTVSGVTNSNTSAASGLRGGHLLNQGMEIITINGVTQSPPVTIQTQLTMNVEGTFTGNSSGNNNPDGTCNIYVTNLTGQIPVPSLLRTPSTVGGTVGTFLIQGAPCIDAQISGTLNGNGLYTYNRGNSTWGVLNTQVMDKPSSKSYIDSMSYSCRNLAGEAYFSVPMARPAWDSMTYTTGAPASLWNVQCPGMNGTYRVSGGANTGPVTMVAKQPDVAVFGYSGVNTATGHMYGQVSATCGRASWDLGPVVQSRFADNYIIPSSAIRYIFPFAVTPGTLALTAVPHGYGGPSGADATAHFIQEGIDCCAHYYEGSTYTCSSGESIPQNTFFIIATTSYSEDHIGPISVTFNTNHFTATSATAIGEGRANIPISGGSFTDTFQFPWTIHFYRINP